MIVNGGRVLCVVGLGDGIREAPGPRVRSRAQGELAGYAVPHGYRLESDQVSFPLSRVLSQLPKKPSCFLGIFIRLTASHPGFCGTFCDKRRAVSAPFRTL